MAVELQEYLQTQLAKNDLSKRDRQLLSKCLTEVNQAISEKKQNEMDPVEAARARLADLAARPHLAEDRKTESWHMAKRRSQLEQYGDEAIISMVPQVYNVHAKVMRLLVDNNLYTKEQLLTLSQKDILSGEAFRVAPTQKESLTVQVLHDIRLIIEAERSAEDHLTESMVPFI